MVTVTSAAAAAEPAESCHFAPASRSACAFSLVRLWTCRLWPAFCRWPAMLRPITPVPINAMFTASLLGEFRGDFQAEVIPRVAKADVLHHRADQLQVGGDRPPGHVGAQQVAERAPEILVARIAEEAAGVGDHADEAAEQPEIGEGVHLPLHALLLVEEPPAAAELELAGDAAVLEAADHRPEEVVIHRVDVVDDRAR